MSVFSDGGRVLRETQVCFVDTPEGRLKSEESTLDSARLLRLVSGP